MKLLAPFVAIASLALATPAFATAINTTTGGFGSDINEFGVPDTSVYGQTFTASSNEALNAFSLYLDGGSGALNFTGNVYAWNGTEAFGPALYTSSVRTYAGSGIEEFSFNVGNVALASGQQYVAFLTTDGVANAGFPGAGMPTAAGGDVYSGGQFVYQNNGGDGSQLTSGYWATSYVGNNDVAFKASFGTAASAVPETATWLMMILGFGAIGGVMRRAHRKSEERFTSQVRAIAAA